MLKLSAVLHTPKRVTNRDVEDFLLDHPYAGMLLCGVAMPVVSLVAISALCYAVMLPVSFLMGWM